MDTDNPDHIGWLYKTALDRANEFKIEGVTWSLTQGVVKNIIPAVASTNAVIAGKSLSPPLPFSSSSLFFCRPYFLTVHSSCNVPASCCNEAFKIATSSSQYLDNYFMYIGTDGVYSYTFKHERREDCPVCGGKSVLFEVGKEWTVNDLIDALAERPDMYVVDLIYFFSLFYFFSSS